MINKLQTLLMKCTLHILGYKSYKMSTIHIMKELNFLTIHHMIVKETIIFMHKVLYNNSPSVLYNLISYSSVDDNNVRSVRKPRIKISHKSVKVINSLLYRAIYLYNILEYQTKMYNLKKLSRYLQKDIIYIFPNNKIQKLLKE